MKHLFISLTQFALFVICMRIVCSDYNDLIRLISLIAAIIFLLLIIVRNFEKLYEFILKELKL